MEWGVCLFRSVIRSEDEFHNFTWHGLKKAFVGKGKIHKLSIYNAWNPPVAPTKFRNCMPRPCYLLDMDMMWISLHWKG